MFWIENISWFFTFISTQLFADIIIDIVYLIVSSATEVYNDVEQDVGNNQAPDYV